MKLKYSIIIIGLSTLTVLKTEGAASTSQNQSFNWGTLSGLTGVPTPLEEYGLTLGDITTTRIFNPLGQLKHHDSIIVARQINDSKIINPWQELTPGTGLIVDGKKAVIQKIEPESPPENEGVGLRIKLTVQEIGGTSMDLEWEQVPHKLNWSEGKEDREKAVNKIQENLRVGTHLILNGERIVITKRKINDGPLNLTANKILTFEADYHSLKGDGGTLKGEANPTENINDAAWKLIDAPINLPEINLPNNTAQLITWKFRSRDNDPDDTPPVTILHRAKGVVSDIDLLDDKTANVHFLFKYNGKSFTEQLSWKQEQALDGKKQSSQWQLTSTFDDFIEIHRVNDSNIQFSITPDSLIEANQEAAKFFERKKHNTGGNNLSSNILDAETIANHIKNLKEIVDSDASKTVKIDAKRQALIYLARFYEHQAELIKSLEQEQLFRSEIKLNRARMYERHAWLNNQKMKLLEKGNEELRVLEGTPVNLDPEINDLNISAAHEELKQYAANVVGKLDGSYLKAQYRQLKGNYEAYKKEADDLRPEDNEIYENRKTQAEYKQEAKKNYNLALQFWSEYIYRTEGLKAGAPNLSENGIEGNTPPPDPYLPEILLRQAWIYRQMNLTDRAISTYYDVLTGATKQKIDNLIRFKRIELVARSQIANCFYEDAEDAEDLSEAVNLYQRLVPLKNKEPDSSRELDASQELDISQVELKLVRALFQANDLAQRERRRLERKFEQLLNRMISKEKLDRDVFEQTKKTGEFDDEEEEQFAEKQLKEQEALNKQIARAEKLKLDNKVAEIEQNRTKNWQGLSKYTEQFERRIGNIEPDLSNSGEIKYYKILADQALGREQQVEREISILIENESAPEELKAAWLATRVRVIIDVSNLMYSEAIRQQELRGRFELQFINQDNEAEEKLETKLNSTDHALPEYLEQAIEGYNYALKFDLTYRSQIMLRQQIAFCQERLNRNEDAIETYKKIISLCEMHPKDVTLALEVVQKMANLKYDNLNEQKNKSEK
ncbi:MAG TPA: hypothetical protein DEB48_11000 [Verrucomicrobiales bacterium]|nr:hypothetical protein [Verrucomicrobiales bacterium]